MMKLLVRFRATSNPTWFPIQSLTSSAQPPTNLFSRIAKFQRDDDVSVVPILDQWVGSDGQTVDQDTLRGIIKQLRIWKRFHHALQVSQWMCDKGLFLLSPIDVAVRLGLISKVHGLEQAEEYFDKVPNYLRVWQVYQALLNCYASWKIVDKSEVVLQKLRELSCYRTLSYNIMLNLYSQLRMYEKLYPLLQEMMERDVYFDIVTYNTLLNAYVASSNIQEMEMLLRKMEIDPAINMEWNAYVIAVNGYMKVGYPAKALMLQKQSEHLMRVKGKTSGYKFLLTIYARLGKKDEVYRIWDLQKKQGKVFSRSYLCMMSSLATLDDLAGVEKIYEEWEALNMDFNFELPRFLINTYCKKGLLGKAESFINKLVESGKEPADICEHILKHLKGESGSILQNCVMKLEGISRI